MAKPYEVEQALQVTGLPHRSLPFIHGAVTCCAVMPESLNDDELCEIVFTVDKDWVPPQNDPGIVHVIELLYALGNGIIEILPAGLFNPYLGERVAGATGMQAAQEWCQGFVAASLLRKEWWWEGELQEEETNPEAALAFALLRGCALPPDDRNTGDYRLLEKEFAEPEQGIKKIVEILDDYLTSCDDYVHPPPDEAAKVLPAGRESRPDSNAEKILPVTARDVPGRNEPCACGSGKKYKQCCGRG